MPVEEGSFEVGLDNGEPPLVRLRRIIDCLEKYRVDIEKALWYGGNTHTFDYVCQRVLKGDLDLYELRNSVLLCEFKKYPLYSVYHVYIAAGNLDEILGFEKRRIHEEARLRKCSKITFTGRRGWKRPLEQRGWEEVHITMAKDVKDG